MLGSDWRYWNVSKVASEVGAVALNPALPVGFNMRFDNLALLVIQAIAIAQQLKKSESYNEMHNCTDTLTKGFLNFIFFSYLRFDVCIYVHIMFNLYFHVTRVIMHTKLINGILIYSPAIAFYFLIFLIYLET